MPLPNELTDQDLLNLANEIKSYQLQPKARVYLVSSRFVYNLESFASTKKVPIIQNKELQESFKRCSSSNSPNKNRNKNKAKKNKIPELTKDFYVMNQNVWEELVMKFGGGPELSFYVCDDLTLDTTNFDITVKYLNDKRVIQTSARTDMETFHHLVLEAFQIEDFAQEYKLTSSKFPNQSIPPEGTVGGRIANEKLLILTFPKKVEEQPKAQDKPKPLQVKEKKQQKEIVEPQIISDKPLGLKNTGNSCYMNSIIQCLASLNPLLNHLETLQRESQLTFSMFDKCSKIRGLAVKIHQKQYVTTEKFIQLMEKLKNRIADTSSNIGYYKGKHSYRPTNARLKYQTAIELKRSMSLFSNSQQQDSHEFFSFLIDAVHDECPHTTEKIFYGSSRRIIICDNCKNQADIIEKFSSLPLAISASRKVIYSPYDLRQELIRTADIPETAKNGCILLGKTRKGTKIVNQLSNDLLEVMALEIPDLSDGNQNPDINCSNNLHLDTNSTANPVDEENSRINSEDVPDITTNETEQTEAKPNDEKEKDTNESTIQNQTETITENNETSAVNHTDNSIDESNTENDTNNDEEEDVLIENVQFGVAMIRITCPRDKNLPILIKVPIGVPISNKKLTEMIKERLSLVLKKKDITINLIQPPKIFELGDIPPLCKNPLSCKVSASIGLTRLETLFTKSDVPISVDEMLNSYFNMNQLDEDNMWMCDKCQNNSCAYTQLKILDSNKNDDEFQITKMASSNNSKEMDIINYENVTEANHETSNEENIENSNEENTQKETHKEEIANSEIEDKKADKEVSEQIDSQEIKETQQEAAQFNISELQDSKISNGNENKTIEDNAQTEESENQNLETEKSFHVPQCLILQLKRFVEKNGHYSRDSTPVIIPKRISIKRFIELKNTEGDGSNVDETKYEYHLVAVSNHSGSLRGGHYTAYGERDSQWYNFNDMNVSINNSLFHNATNGTESFESSSAYVLFYSKT